MRLPRLPIVFPPSGPVLIFFCALYLLPGLIGHDPWKNEDVTHFGVVLSLLEDGHWLAPQLAGEPWLTSPPLYYWTAAVSGKVFGLIMPLHDAARLASGLFVAVMLAGLAATARILFDTDAARGAILIAIGSLGLLVHAHEMQPLTALLAAMASLYYGVALFGQRPRAGGLVAGAALASGFLAQGFQALLILAPIFLLMPFLPSQRTWDERLRGALAALALALPLLALWPALLYWLEPSGFSEWWRQEMADLHMQEDWLEALWSYLKLIGWFSWPALPLALWTLWKQRRHLFVPAILIPLVCVLSMFALQIALFDLRSLNALTLLPPLILLAAPATATLRRGAANAFDWFGMMIFTALAGLLWLGWLAMTTGVPGRLARSLSRLEPGFVGHFSLLAFTAALILTLAWLWLILTSPRSPQRGATHWAAGVMLCWALATILWMPWVDHGRSYRQVFTHLKAALPHQTKGCIGTRGINNAQQAALYYFADIRVRREGVATTRTCSVYLIQSSAKSRPLPPGKGWRLIWEGNRPSDRNERFRLYSKQ